MHPDIYDILLVFRPGPTGDRFEEYLQGPAWRVQRAPDGEQALRMMRAESWQAIIYEESPQRMAVDLLLEAGSKLILRPVQLVAIDHLPIEKAAALFRHGADDFVSVNIPAGPFEAKLRDLLLSRPAILPQAEEKSGSPLDRLIGRSGAMTEVKTRLARLAPARSTVLFTGETGTGKSLAAEVLHALSPRSEGPYRQVHCPALSRTLVESELFGHAQGAFTDAKQTRKGIIERSGGGTVLLEEVGDLPGPTQSGILRLLETGEIRRIGSNEIIRPDVRVLVATAEPLDQLAFRGGIRKNLLYRLEGVRVHLPPLRERREDIRDLVRYYLHRLAKAAGRPTPKITRRALQRLAGLDWPGNVRQLVYTLEGMLASTSEDLLDISDISLELRARKEQPEMVSLPVGSTLAEAEKLLISKTLKFTGGNKNRAARMLGIGLRTLYRKINLYDL
jgi:two-component system, NtrC family, response regulator HydG